MLAKLQARMNMSDLDRVIWDAEKIRFLEQWYGLAYVVAIMLIPISWDYIKAISAALPGGISLSDGIWRTLVLLVHMYLFDAGMLFCLFKWKEGRDSLLFWIFMAALAKVALLILGCFAFLGVVGMIIGL